MQNLGFFRLFHAVVSIFYLPLNSFFHLRGVLDCHLWIITFVSQVLATQNAFLRIPTIQFHQTNG